MPGRIRGTDSNGNLVRTSPWRRAAAIAVREVARPAPQTAPLVGPPVHAASRCPARLGDAATAQLCRPNNCSHCNFVRLCGRTGTTPCLGLQHLPGAPAPQIFAAPRSVVTMWGQGGVYVPLSAPWARALPPGRLYTRTACEPPATHPPGPLTVPFIGLRAWMFPAHPLVPSHVSYAWPCGPHWRGPAGSRACTAVRVRGWPPWHSPPSAPPPASCQPWQHAYHGPG